MDLICGAEIHSRSCGSQIIHSYGKTAIKATITSALHLPLSLPLPPCLPPLTVVPCSGGDRRQAERPVSLAVRPGTWTPYLVNFLSSVSVVWCVWFPSIILYWGAG